jgi:carbamoyl-phosphate synthase large subunit
MERAFTLLISSVGRRVQLVECFRRAAKELDLRLTVLGVDAAPELSPASQLVDRCFQVPLCSAPKFIQELLAICGKESVNLIVPTVDPELPIYARYAEEFATVGTRVLVSSEETIDIASDKWSTNEWLRANGFPTVLQDTIENVIDNWRQWTFPVIVKPRRGSASSGVRVVSDPRALCLLTDRDGLLVESIAHGIEHTTNVFLDRDGRCLCAVPHQRIETRGGEVSKGMTVKNHKLMKLAQSIAEALPGGRGPLNLQGFVDSNSEIQFTEINARFGG